jgi:hypothetical protein
MRVYGIPWLPAPTSDIVLFSGVHGKELRPDGVLGGHVMGCPRQDLELELERLCCSDRQGWQITATADTAAASLGANASETPPLPRVLTSIGPFQQNPWN